MQLMVINGPNLNKLGSRDPEQYGTGTYMELLQMIEEKNTEKVSIRCFQSNSEGRIIDYIQQAGEDYDGIVINPGAYSHYSYAIMDALADVDIPKVEVHISDVLNREDFRSILITARSCDRMISGHGFKGYLEAIDYLTEVLDEHQTTK
ncbi:MAG TPA: type II 3-dehydroquinate dehydratase [Clostridia bacterium]|nr:type II 3-dehydroquinate dehydratase [Clostridia bacterium]